MPLVPSTNASESSQASAPRYDARSSRRHDSLAARSAAYRQPRRAIATEARVPGPNTFGCHRPYSGGTSEAEALRGPRGATSQPSH